MKGQKMIQKIKSSILAIAMLLVPGIVLVPATVFAQDSIQTNICKGVGEVTGDTTSGCDGETGPASADGLYALARQIVDIFSVIVGIIAIIMIIFGGFKYITSGGDSGSVSGAKNTLIYAIVGLIIVALAQFIVRFVLNTTNDLTTG